MSHIVLDTHGETGLRAILLEFVEYRLDHARRKLFTRQTVPSPDKTDSREPPFVTIGETFERSNYVKIERFTHGAGFFGAIKHRKRLHAFRKRIDEMSHRKRAKESYYHHTHLFAL